MNITIHNVIRKTRVFIIYMYSFSRSWSNSCYSSWNNNNKGAKAVWKWSLASGGQSEDMFMCLFVITVMSNIGLAPMSSSPVCQFSVHVCHRLMYCSESSDHDNILKFQYWFRQYFETIPTSCGLDGQHWS